MPRSPRIDYPNAYHHVLNRGIVKNSIFFNDKSYEIFLEILGESYEKFGVIIHSYCLMTNHYHLLVQTLNANLSKFMQRLNSFYTQRYNKFMEIDGPIFKGRYKSIVGEDDSYFIGLNRYIHCNPVGFGGNLRNYKWSSFPSYLRLNQCQDLLNKDRTLEILSMTNNIEKYEESTVGGQTPRCLTPFDNPSWVLK